MDLAALQLDPHDCVLAIVGSRDVPNYASESLVREAILEHKPKMVVSGGALGVDQQAVTIAASMNIATTEFAPKVRQWEAREEGQEEVNTNDLGIKITVPGGFRSRNARIAQTCTCLVRIYSGTTETYGSGWTADYAEQIGKNVVRHLVGS